MRDTFEHVITRNSERLIDDWRRDGHVDLVKQFTQKLPLSVILDVLGLDPDMKPTFRVWYNAIHDYFTNISGDEAVHQAGLRKRRITGLYAAVNRRTQGKSRR